MATLRELAPRVLRKLMVLAAGETGSNDDLTVAAEKLLAVHAALQVDDLVRWTLQDVPKFAEEPYVLMAAFMAAADFERTPDPGMWAVGLRQIQSGVSLRASGVTYAEYF